MDIYDLSTRRYRKHHLRRICIGTGVEEEAEERKIDSLRYNQQYSGVVQMCKGLDNNATSLIYQTVHGGPPFISCVHSTSMDVGGRESDYIFCLGDQLVTLCHN